MGMRLTGSLLEMSTPRGGSLLSLSSKLWNGTTTSIWIGFHYKHLDWIAVRRDDDKLYKFKKGDFKRTMATTIKQQVALDEALVPCAQSPRVSGLSFAELPFEEEIMEFLRFLGHSAQIKTLIDVNVNKLYQPWRSFAVVNNKCLTGKSSGIDSLRWYRDTRILNNTGAILPIELTTKDIRNTKAYKEYYACATGEAAPKPKASARRKRGGSASSTTLPTPIATPTPITTVVAAPRLFAAAKGKQPAKTTSPTDPLDVELTKAAQLKIVLRRSRHKTHISQQGGSSTNEGTDVDDQTKGSDDNEGEKTDESNDDDDDEEEISKIDEQEATESGEGDDEEAESDGENDEDDGDGEEDQGLRISEEERMHEEEEADELYHDVNINQGRGLQVSQDIDDSHVTLTLVHTDGQQESSSTSSFVTGLLNLIIDLGMESIFMTGSSFVTHIPSPKSTMTPSIMTTTTTASQPPTPPTPIPSDILQTLLTFASVFRFEDRVKSLEVNFSEFMRTNQSSEAISNILGIVHQYMHQEMTEAVREAVQTQTNQLQDSIQRENNEFLRTIDDNMKKIIKEQVKSQDKAQVTRILPRIEKSVNAQLEAEVLTRSSHSSRTSYAVAADLSEMELKKILIDKMEGNKHEDDDDQEGPSAGSDRGSKRRREGGEHASASTPSEPATTSAGRSTTRTQSRQMSAGESAFVEEPVQTTCQMEEPSHPVFEIAAQGNAQSWISALAKQTDACSSFNELLDTPIDFSNFIMNWLDVDTLTLELLAGPTYELMRGSSRPLGSFSLGRKRQQFYGFAVNRESALDVYSKRRVIAVTDLKLVEWHNYKYLDWISVHRDDDKIYKFKEGDFKRLRLQDIKDMMLLLRRVEDLQLGVESYQKRLNLTKPDTYRSDLKRREAYTAYSNQRGFIYQNKDKKNRLMRIDKLHKFSDGTLNDVRNALDDHLKGIRMQYLPTTIWRKGDKDRASAMIQAIDMMLKTKRIMRSLERFVGGRQYEGDF
nr:hypothetical protein [Tanacetum cinerariifolium]